MAAELEPEILFAGGVNESIDPRVMPADQNVTSLLNVVFPQDGGYATRFGLTELGSSFPFMATVKRLAVFTDELLAIDSNATDVDMYSYAPALADSWKFRATLSPCRVTRQPGYSAMVNFTSFDIAVCNGLIVECWVEPVNDDPYVRILDATTGAVVLDTTLVMAPIFAVRTIRCVAIGTTHVAIVIAADGVTTVQGCTINMSTLAVSATLTLSTANRVSTAGIVAVTGMSDRFAVAYEANAIAGVPQVEVRTFSSTPALIASTSIGVTGGAHTAIAAHGTTGERLWIAYSYNNAGTPTTRALARDPAALTLSVGEATVFTTAQDPVRIGIGRVSSTQCLVAASSPSPSVVIGDYTQWRQFNSGGAVGTSGSIYNLFLVSEPFLLAGRWCAVVQFRSTVQGTYFVIDLSQDDVSVGQRAYPLAIVAPRLANISTTYAAPYEPVHCISAPTLSTGKVVTVVALGAVPNGDRDLERITIDSTHAERWSNSQLGRALYMGGESYDGTRVHETGYPWFPSMILNAPAGGNVDAGAHSWVAVYEWYDSQGAIHRSAPSTAYPYTLGGASSLSFAVKCLSLTKKDRGVEGAYIVLYRTTAGGTIYYRCAAADPSSSTQGATANSPQSDTVNVIDNISDATLTDGTHALLYTEGGVLDNVCPPSFTQVVTYKGRIIGVGDDERTCWVSQAYEDGTAPGFHELLTLQLQGGGAITALAVLDDKLILFTKSEIYLVVGDGPGPSGIGSDLSVPSRISTDAGCIDSRSVVATPDGVMFQGSRGLMLLTRGLEVIFIGDPVSRTTTTYPVCAAAVLVPAQSHVRFSMRATADSDAGRVVVYDYRRKRWTIFAYHEPTDTVTFVAGHAVLHPLYGYCISRHDTGGDAVISRERFASDSTPWLDSRFIPVTIETGWVHPAGQQAYHDVARLLVLAERKSKHGLQVSVARDYSSSYHQTETFTEADITAIGSLEQVRVRPSRGKSQAIKVKLVTTGPAVDDTGEGATFTGLRFLMRARPRGYANIGVTAKR